MVTINLRDFYKESYKRDYFVDVPEEVAAVLKIHRKEDWTLEKRTNRKRMFLSLDCNDGVEYHVRCLPVAAEKVYFQSQEKLESHESQEFLKNVRDAFACLSEKQAKRIYAHAFLGIEMQEIAKMEGVAKSSVSESIKRGRKRMKKAHIC